jgi:cytosolic carboxypeptidase protein 2/3
MSSMKKEQGQKAKAGFIIRSTKTPVLTDRCRTERLSLVCRPQIEFNSNFESGNLFKAFQREYNEYDLILQNDINTRGNNQWFFFSVRNVPKGTTVKFNIVNMAKRFSLFDYGMKPSVFSMMRFERRQVGWVRDGSKLNYR